MMNSHVQIHVHVFICSMNSSNTNIFPQLSIKVISMGTTVNSPPLSFLLCPSPYFCVLCCGRCIDPSATSIVVVCTRPALPHQLPLGVLDCVEGRVLHGDPPRAAIAVAAVKELPRILPLDKDGQSQLQSALLSPPLPCPPSQRLCQWGMGMRLSHDDVIAGGGWSCAQP